MRKRLIFLCGPNGVGKTALCREILCRTPGSAYVDSDPLRQTNPFVLSDETAPAIQKNLSCVLTNYLQCPAVDTVLFSYGLHGRRREIFEGVLEDLAGQSFRFFPFLLTCGEAENVRRMRLDGRDEARIERALRVSRAAYDDVPYPKIDVTHLSVPEAAALILARCAL